MRPDLDRGTRAPEFAARCKAARCRACGRPGLRPVVDFGMMPLSDGFAPADAAAVDAREPLALAFCAGCGLAQLLDTLSPSRLFGPDYVYLSSVSATLAEAAQVNAEELSSRYGLGKNSLVVELACNDGGLLRHFAAREISVLGIEPAPIPAAAAREAGVPLLESFFSFDLARELVARGVKPDLVIANNVVAHVPDPHDFVAGVASLLAPGGTAVVEVHSLASLVAQGQFDTIYHEHASYFSATSIAALFRRHRLELVDVKEAPLQGGSLRLHFTRDVSPSRNVSDQLAAEARAGIADGSALATFAKQVARSVARIRSVLTGFASEGCSIAAYGAAAKGTMLLNHVGLGERVIRYVVDRNPHKQGRRVPGVKVPICSLERLLAEPPDVILILPWNLRDEIVASLEPLRKKGVRLVVPLPDVEIL
ncbi:MAG: class I SAM-dependent methyltransferase [Xanthobacteraceae bacterium]